MMLEEGIRIGGSFDKLNHRVRSIPKDLTMEEADKFLSQNGYKKVRQKGSHCIYKRPSSRMINLQGPIIEEYQVRQMIDAVDS